MSQRARADPRRWWAEAPNRMRLILRAHSLSRPRIYTADRFPPLSNLLTCQTETRLGRAARGSGDSACSLRGDTRRFGFGLTTVTGRGLEGTLAAVPWRELQREQGWLMPPTLEELLAEDHPARVVAAFVDSLTRAEWSEIGIDVRDRQTGARAYHPRALLGVWLYGFMNGVRSTRKLEAACREQLPYLWLAGGQRPDHNTLWRFWQHHRLGLRRLLTEAARAIARLELIDRSVQAVDGTKFATPASNRWSLNREEVDRWA